MKTLLLIDANSFIHRAFHALPPLTAPDGRPTGALYGLTSILLKTLRELSPDFVAAAFDRPEPTFRKKEYDEYKAHRPPAPEELISQIKEARKVFEVFRIAQFEKPGYEADDILGTLAKKFSAQKIEVKILTGDLDTLQLVKDGEIVVITPRRGMGETTIYDQKAVEERFGVKPEQMIDYKGLAGDSSDNIPGVPGIGPKTAAKILQEYGSLEKAVEAATKRKKESASWKKIADYKEQALLSKRLAALDCSVPIETELSQLTFTPPNLENMKEYFTSLGFQSLLKRLEEAEGGEINRPKNGAVPKKTASKENASEREPSSPTEKKIALEWKPLLKKLDEKKWPRPETIFDITVAAWLLGYAPKKMSLGSIAEHFLRKVGENGNVEEKLCHTLSAKLQKEGLNNIFTNLEMPLIPILAAMEKRGILVNREQLEETERKIKKTLEELTKEIYKHAGKPFNINSPREVGSVLFETLKLKSERVKKTATGQRRTDKEVLESLRNSHLIVPAILRYREDFKIKTGFLEPLLAAQENDGRIHTSFLQTGTATGRLASEHPNLQNIPQESQWAEPTRNAFISEKGWTLVSLDYSQLELRLLAHVTGDERLKTAFRKGEDVHRLTAAAIFHKTLGEVTQPMRRVGKTLNFGIVYGMGTRSLSQMAGISREEAQTFIEDYFKTFTKVKVWQASIKEHVALHGFVDNINGRKRWFPREAPQGVIERAAINMPIQSLGADIIKKTMITTTQKMSELFGQEQVRLLLSIHDELLFEVPDDIVKRAIPPLKECMEGALNLSVPLIAEIKTGKQWGNMKKHG